MAKRFLIVVVLLLLCQDFVWAQRASKEDDRAARKQWEEEQRADEYANSLRRRDWLKDRLILELGMGTKFPVMGENWFGFGAGVEYITRWHASAFLTAGFIPGHDDPVMPEYELAGGMGWRVGLAYYMFPKSPIHLGFQLSYGTVFYGHKSEPDDFEKGGKSRGLITCNGYEFDLTVSYLTDQWYFLQAIVGMYYIGNGLKDGGNKMGMTNDSYKMNDDGDKLLSLVTEVKRDGEKAPYGLPSYGVVFGVGIGFAFEEFFPDDTEVRRREREQGRANQNQFRSTSASSKKQGATKNSRSSKAAEEEQPAEEEFEF